MSRAPLSLVLLCSTHAFGGMEMNVLRLGSWMQERGHRVTIAGSRAAPLLEDARQRGLATISLPSPWRYGAVRSARILSRHLQRHSIPFLIANASRDLNLAVLTRRCARSSVQVLFTQHMQLGGSKLDVFHRWQHRQLAAWIAPLPWLAQQAAAWTAVPSSRIHTIPFGIELGQFASLPDQPTARTTLALPDTAFIAGTIGRLDPGKGQEYLLAAVAALRDEGCDVHALLVGDETRDDMQGYGAHLRRITAELKLEDRVHFRPFMPSVGPALAAMDCFALTSLSETYGMVTIEAMAAGLPVIGTNAGGTPDLLGAPEGGLLIPPRDVPALSAALRTLHTDPALRTAIGRTARSRAQETFSHTAQCEALEAVCEPIAAQKCS